jgi:hypothetical protein
MRRSFLATMILAIIAAAGFPGCGGDDSSLQRPSAAASEQATYDGTQALREESGDASLPVSDLIERVRDCLKEVDIDARGGAHDRPAEDANAPDGELVTGDATFIAFYESAARAEQLEGGLRDRARELGGALTRHGQVTVFYTETPNGSGDPDDRIERCAAEART